MRKHLFFFLSISFVFAQNPQISADAARLQSFEQQKSTHSPISLDFRNVGPAIMSGRVVDLEVNEANPNEFYAAFASGGVWHTTSNGTDFQHIFSHQAMITVGDIAVNWKDKQQIWVGTGENNSSRSSYAGTGMYYSEDKGKTWEHRGLTETHHIGRIVLHPQKANTLWVAAIGHLYSKNSERGVFKTTDAGKTWKNTLFVNDSTGGIDLVIDPSNPMILYAATWTRTRKASNFNGCGSGSGIYKSIDGGETWELVTNATSGFPTGEKVGRIGLAISSLSPQTLYAVLDNQAYRPKEEDKKETTTTVSLTKNELKAMSKEEFLKLEAKKLNLFLDDNDFPKKYTAKTLQQQVKEGKLQVADISNYLADADNDLFDTPIVGGEVYRSNDGGKTWKKTNEHYLDGLYYTYGYYFGQVRVSPFSDEEIYLLGVPVLYSKDGGKTFEGLLKENVHPDNHALWLNPKQKGHFILGNDGGVNLTYNNGNEYFKLNNLPTAQCYAIALDSLNPYNIYAGLQDNGVWKGSSQSQINKDWHDSGENPFKMVMGGDGMQIQVDNRDNKTIYTGYQFGNYSRIENGKQFSIAPSRELGEDALRFNWQTPILLSKFNQDILYMGAQKLFRSMNKGATFEAISPDLTQNQAQGNVPYNTITCIAESPFKFGVICVGTDDGNVQLTTDNGENWENIGAALPQNHWVSRVVFSQHNKKRIYVSLNAYRTDNFEPQVYVSENQGESWNRIGKDLPIQAVNVIKEDPSNEKILYVGTDNGLFVSLNQGKTFHTLNNATLPNVAVHDVAIHGKAKELVVGTHGLSVLVADVQYLQKLTEEILNHPLTLFEVDSLVYDKEWGKRNFGWKISDTPSVKIHFYQAQKANTTLKVVHKKGILCYQKTLKEMQGLQSVSYNLSMDSTQKELIAKELKTEIPAADNGIFYLPAGEYELILTSNGIEKRTPLLVSAPKKKKDRGE
ncbi:MAG: VPS10 domain-containing protein [Bacteroidia bacterium]